MLTLRNKKNQPFTFHLKDGKSLYLGPRASLQIQNESLSVELQRASERGLLEIQESPQEDAADTTSTEGQPRRRK